MSTIQAPVSDMLVTVKSREIQRGMLAELAGDKPRAARHFLAAAHLELVLANDYAQTGLDDLAYRSRISAGSCFWRAGDTNAARSIFDDVIREDPSRTNAVQELLTQLARNGSD